MSKVAFYDSTSRANHVEVVRTAIGAAEKEVFVVNWPAEEPDPAPGLADTRETYFEELLNRCRLHGLQYIRVLQIADPARLAAAIGDGYDRQYGEHFRRMLDHKDEMTKSGRRSNVQLLTMPLTIPGTFVIIDGKHLIWEICQILETPTENGISWQSGSSMQISDTDGETAVAQFRAMLDLVCRANAREIESLPARHESRMTFDLSPDEALVLFDLLRRWDTADAFPIVDPAEQRGLWNLLAALEKQLVEPFSAEYVALVAAAKERLRASEG